MSIEENLDRVLRRHDELSALLADPATVEKGSFADLSREYAELEPIVDAVKGLRAARQELADLEDMLTDGDDPEMKQIFKEEEQWLIDTFENCVNQEKLWAEYQELNISIKDPGNSEK